MTRRRRTRRQQPATPDADEDLRDFAHRAQLHTTYLASLERGERNPPVWMLYRIAAVAQVPIADLIPEGPPGGARPGRLIFCPGCDLAETSVLKAYERDEPCPSCGLPTATIQEVLAARRRAVGPYE